MSWIISKLKEASTWRAVIWILTACGVTLTDYQSEGIITAGLSLVGLIDLFKTDNKTATEK